MSDPMRRLQSVLDDRADGPVGPPPIEQLVRHGHRRHRLRQAALVGASAVVSVVVVLVAVVVAAGGSGRSISPAPPATVSTGPSVSQIVHGRWSDIAASPLGTCDAAPLSIGAEVLAIRSGTVRPANCASNSAAVYNPATNRWHRLARPPVGLRHDGLAAAWTGSKAVVLNTVTGAVATLDPTTNRWTRLDPPTLLRGAAVVADGQRVAIVTVGTVQVQALVLDGSTWTRSAPFQVPSGATPYLAGKTLWALVDEGAGHQESIHAFRLAGTRWVEGPQPVGLPTGVNVVQSFGSGQIVSGEAPGCRAGVLCSASSDAASVSIIRLGTTEVHRVPSSPFGSGMDQAVPAGGAIVGINGSAGHVDRYRDLQLGAAAVYDPSTDSWQLAPELPTFPGYDGAVWTTSGLVELTGPVAGAPHAAGVILRPAR